MGKKTYPSPEAWANSHADKVAKTVRSKATRMKLPKAAQVGCDRILKASRAVWATLQDFTHPEILKRVEEVVMTWASEEIPPRTSDCVKIPGVPFSGGKSFRKGGDS